MRPVKSNPIAQFHLIRLADMVRGAYLASVKDLVVHKPSIRTR